MKKEVIRKKIRALRNTHALSLKKSKDKKIAARLMGLQAFKQCKEFFTYLSFEGEVSTDLIMFKALGRKKIIVPFWKNSRLELAQLPVLDLHTGKHGIREPMRPFLQKEWGTIEVALIPGIAFDERGHRIGFGGGHFDRLLKKLHTTTIGLAYEFQMIDKVPDLGHDVPVDFIVTEKRIISCRANRLQRP